jgi:cobalamin biosynthesis Mg chelatase CobN
LSKKLVSTELAKLHEQEREKVDGENATSASVAETDVAPIIDITATPTIEETSQNAAEQKEEKDSKTQKREARRSRKMSRSDVKAGLESQIAQAQQNESKAKEGSASPGDPTLTVEEGANSQSTQDSTASGSVPPQSAAMKREKRNSRRMSRTDLKEEMRKADADKEEKRKSVCVFFYFIFIYLLFYLLLLFYFFSVHLLLNDCGSTPEYQHCFFFFSFFSFLFLFFFFFYSRVIVCSHQ